MKYVPSVKPGASLPISPAAAVAAVVVGALMILVLEVLVVAGGVPHYNADGGNCNDVLNG